MSDILTKSQIRAAIGTGRAVLVTGAGFSRGAVDRFGDSLPLGRELCQGIWPIAFGNEAFDSGASLGEVFHIANKKSGRLLKSYLEDVFRVDRTKVPQRYQDWFSLPWHRVYTLNVDDLDEAIVAQTKSEVRLKVLSAVTSTPGDAVADSDLAVVHLNGRLENFPDLTFDAPSYGARTAFPDAWYQQFIADIVTRPTIFVGTVLDESPLWHYLSQRGSKGQAAELRPQSWLVAPGINAAKRELLEGYNINLLQMDEADFYDEFLSPDMAYHRQRATELQSTAGANTYLLNVADIVAQQPKGDPYFLTGREPEWGDVLNGYAAEFDFELLEIEAVRKLSGGVRVIHGGAASGKTTLIMRLASVLSAEGNKVVWVTRETVSSPGQIRAEVRAQAADYVFVDDLDRFGAAGPALLANLAQDDASQVVIAAIRTPRFNQLEYRKELPDAEVSEIPILTDSDAGHLVDALERGNRLGALLGLSRQARIAAVTTGAERQLLVSLIEATSGRKLHDKVADECDHLTGLDLAAYGVLCAALASDNQYLTNDDVLIAIDASNNQGVAAIKRLIRDHLVVEQSGRLKVRHRVIAESAVDHFREQGYLHKWIENLLFLFAVKYDPQAGTRGRYGRLLIRFLNHDFLKKQLVTTQAIQLVYGTLEEILKGDFHYWLQRGSFEVEAGDLDHAETFLAQALALKAGDHFAETSWAYCLLKKALVSPQSPSSTLSAREALALLESLMQSRPSDSPNTFHVYLSQGYKWLDCGQLGNQECVTLRERLQHFRDIARYQFPNNEAIQEIVAVLDRFFLTYQTPSEWAEYKQRRQVK